MVTIDHRSDILIENSFTDEAGQPMGIPAYDFEFEYYVFPNNSKKVSKVNGVYTGCSANDNKVIVPFDHPNFERGRLMCKRTYYIPSNMGFADSKETFIETTQIATII